MNDLVDFSKALNFIPDKTLNTWWLCSTCGKKVDSYAKSKSCCCKHTNHYAPMVTTFSQDCVTYRVACSTCNKHIEGKIFCNNWADRFDVKSYNTVMVDALGDDKFGLHRLTVRLLLLQPDGSSSIIYSSCNVTAKLLWR